MISLLKVAAPRLDRTRSVSDKVVSVADMDSTHAEARRMVERGEVVREGVDGHAPITVIAADYLDNALVRFGRPWITVPGRSLTVTVVTMVPAEVADDELLNGWLAMIAELAALDALEGAIDECGARPYDEDCGFKLKWPNDIYCHGLKIGGTVTEVMPVPGDASERAVAFSFGANLLVPADRLPTAKATSLQMNVGPLPGIEALRDGIVSRFVESLRGRLEAFVSAPLVQSGRLRSEMRHVCWMMGREIDAQLIDGSAVHGVVVALNDDASISVRTDDGEIRALLSSEVGLLQ
ncbi:biotin--acetyl-CoA-carboxylase ligase [Bifidobacterium sp. MA2]|uniref:Biotin--acetyl-CoA-carboxylase ligase n=1 Tax=Bifidobacterium santillanense TaxID=2809028 RepID=A0ABS5URD5_9BIFI|nr:biotin--acetyl-CoA-carboxylase ligase [Bifidobacterium santillanense]MBT1173474.1 biotin--acetyl-CoA-carboxylase ligase [Bifidobacterium santillanense]